MYRTVVFTLGLGAAIVITTLANISYSQVNTFNTKVSAQEIQNNDTPEQQVLGDTDGNNSATRSYWFWLLPLLALPFLLLIFRTKNDDELDSQLWPYDQYQIGSKGGKSTSSTEEELFL